MTGLPVFQLQLAKAADVLPRTRDYIMAEEARLAAAGEAAAPRVPRPEAEGNTARF